MGLRALAVAALIATAGFIPGASAQTMSYGDAGALLARSCGPDIEKFCAKVNLGGGAIQNCLARHEAQINPQCVTDYRMAVASLTARAAAQAAVPQLCQQDAAQYCQGVKPGDAHVISCLDKAKRVVSAACQGALLNAGWN
jgi:hypothetical protein